MMGGWLVEESVAAEEGFGRKLWVGGGVVSVHVGVGREVTYHSTSVARANCTWVVYGVRVVVEGVWQSKY